MDLTLFISLDEESQHISQVNFFGQIFFVIRSVLVELNVNHPKNKRKKTVVIDLR